MRNALFITPREQQLVYGKFIFLLSSSFFFSLSLSKSYFCKKKGLTQQWIHQCHSIERTGGLPAQWLTYLLSGGKVEETNVLNLLNNSESSGYYPHSSHLHVSVDKWEDYGKSWRRATRLMLLPLGVVTGKKRLIASDTTFTQKIRCEHFLKTRFNTFGSRQAQPELISTNLPPAADCKADH